MRVGDIVREAPGGLLPSIQGPLNAGPTQQRTWRETEKPRQQSTVHLCTARLLNVLFAGARGRAMNNPDGTTLYK